VDTHAVPAHMLNHGDTLGACPEECPDSATLSGDSPQGTGASGGCSLMADGTASGLLGYLSLASAALGLIRLRRKAK
jgi:hypothetical protein